jgi:cell division protein FtsB
LSSDSSRQSGGLLTRPSEATVQLADAALKTAAGLRARIVERLSRDVETLSDAVAKHEKRIAALQEREKQIEQKINNL